MRVGGGAARAGGSGSDASGDASSSKSDDDTQKTAEKPAGSSDNTAPPIGGEARPLGADLPAVGADTPSAGPARETVEAEDADGKTKNNGEQEAVTVGSLKTMAQGVDFVKNIDKLREDLKEPLASFKQNAKHTSEQLDLIKQEAPGIMEERYLGWLPAQEEPAKTVQWIDNLHLGNMQEVAKTEATIDRLEDLTKKVNSFTHQQTIGLAEMNASERIEPRQWEKGEAPEPNKILNEMQEGAHDAERLLRLINHLSEEETEHATSLKSVIESHFPKLRD